MTIWNHKIDRVPARRIANGAQTCLVACDFGNDYQRGDFLSFEGEGAPWLSGRWEITHVTKNQNGIADKYVVLSLKAPDADYYKRRADSLSESNLRQNRQIAALRGQITKLRNRIEASQ